MSDGSTTSSAFATPIFEIYAGLGRKRFLAHAGVLSKSEILKTLVEGNWKDSIQQKIIWEDWDEDTVARFLQWIYTGDYERPYPTPLRTVEENGKREGSPELPQSTSILPTGGLGELRTDDENLRAVEDLRYTRPRDQNSTTSRLHSVRNPVTSQHHSPPKPISSLPHIPSQLADKLFAEKLAQAQDFGKWPGHQFWSSTELDYEAILLAHAKMYAMANCFMLSELKHLAHRRLYEILRFIAKPKIETSVIEDIIGLIEWVYDHTDTLISKEEPLRALVVNFATANYPALDGPDFQALMSRGGDFVLDLVAELRKQLSSYKMRYESRMDSRKSRKLI